MADAKKIISQLLERYENCDTYSDSGKVFVWDEGFKEPDSADLNFRTLFERPKKFLFEWKTPGGSNIILCDGFETRCQFEYSSEIELHEDVLSAIASATGISEGAAFEIPVLLFPELRERSKHWILIKDWQISDTDTIDGVECFRMSGSISLDGDTILWVSKADQSVKRLRQFTLLTQEWQAEFAKQSQQMLGAHAKDIELLGSDLQEMRYFTEYRYNATAFNQPIAKSDFEYSWDN